jgi:SAM-dependent methyltransferase
MQNWLSKILIFFKLKSQDTPILHATKIFSYDEYNRHVKNHQKDDAENFLFEKSLLPKSQTKFMFSGYCYVCKKLVNFLVDFQYSYEVNNILMPNWRERLECPSCHLVNRMRAIVHLFEQECKPMHDSKIYITEQTTPLYTLLKTTYHNTCGSEYLGDVLGYGYFNQNGIRNEDLTKLSFNNDEFDFILSFDVLEHIPNYRNALLECYRSLKPGGSLFLVCHLLKLLKKILFAPISIKMEI